MRIAYIIPNSRDPSSEEHAGWDFLSSQKRIESKRFRITRLPEAEELRQEYDIVWWHSDLLPDEHLGASAPHHLPILQGFINRGGSLLLSLLPTLLPVALGLEEASPAITRQGEWNEESWAKGYPDIRGFATYRGHPIFHGMTGGLYSWMPTKGSLYSGTLYKDQLPVRAKVIAVERQYIKIIPSNRIAWEFSTRKGGILCLGMYTYLTERHPRVRPHLEQLLTNCFSYLTSPRRRAERATYWSFDMDPPRKIERNSPPPSRRVPLHAVESVGPSMIREVRSGIDGEAFDLGGRRCVILGNEREGIREVWFHPVRGLRNLQMGILGEQGGVTWLRDADSSIEVRPEVLERRFSFGDVMFAERTFAHPTDPVGCLSVRTTGGALHVCLQAEIDLRMMWPLNEGATGTLRYAWDDGLRAAVVSTNSGEIAAVFGSSLRPTRTYIGTPDTLIIAPDGSFAPQGSNDRIVRIAWTLELNPDTPDVTFAFSGSATSEREAELAYRGIREDPGAALVRQTERMRTLQESVTVLQASDRLFTDAYRWAVTGMDRFYLTTPGVGSSYVAGFGTVERGWDGGHDVSGRPGYAWFFGRDAVWTAFAALSIGDFEKVRGVLEFLGKHQDVTGKILHELTTSGFAHYDAADATPLYLILMGRYVRASGHRSFARGEFSRIRRALDFCLSTDTDGDGLIENTNVGHGWVEGGGLFPVHTEHYLASCWSAALREASFVASVADHPHLSKRWMSESDKVHEIVSQDFWDDEKGWYAFAKNRDGTYNRVQTILPAVGLYFGIGNGDRAIRTLRQFAGSDFTTDWGVRIIGASNPMFTPTGYHYGSVWPLFTGWAALAEFRHTRPLQGYMHALSTAMTFQHHAAGSIEEVLHGETFDPAGVCHHQAWSESMVVQPLTEGLLGIDANGLDHTLRISPWIPPQWSSFTASRIRVGQSWLHLSVERAAQTTDVELTLEGRHPIIVDLALRFPLGTHVLTADLAGDVLRLDRVVSSYDQAPSIQVRVAQSVRVVFNHVGGYALVPPVPDLVPGKRSSGLRVIDEAFREGEYRLELEGMGGMSYDLEIIHRGQKLGRTDGCDVLETHVGHSKVRVSFAGAGAYTRKAILVG